MASTIGFDTCDAGTAASYSEDPGQLLSAAARSTFRLPVLLNRKDKVDANCQKLSGMPVWLGTNDLITNLVVGSDFRRPAHGQACSPSFHDLTGQN
ncbi:hypothetical protein [Malonomonas rubra]|uniref:hypothetical protein n=1 Tax=Malonomonas rubra TaxID=57040 RepID=UPI001114FC7A|nr:hypothetical protein [Malonomonas rubra]